MAREAIVQADAATTTRSATPPCGRSWLREVIGQKAVVQRLRHRPQRLQEAQGAAVAHPLRRPARPRQDDLRHRAAQRTGHVDPDDQRPGPVQAGRPAAVPDQRRGRLDPVHRRDPPHAARRRGVHLPGDGGLPHRHRARRGHERPHDLDAAEALHADRRDDAQRHAVRPDARPLQDARAPGVLHASRSWPRSSASTPSKLQTPHHRRRGPGDWPAAAAARRASPTPGCGGRATSPPARPTARITLDVAQAALDDGRGRSARAWTSRTAAIWRR